MEASGNWLTELSARFDLAKSDADVEAVAKAITPEVKKQMVAADVTALKEKYVAAKRRVG